MDSQAGTTAEVSSADTLVAAGLVDSPSCAVCDGRDGTLHRYAGDVVAHPSCAPKAWVEDKRARDAFMDRVRAWVLLGGVRGR